MDHRRKAKNTQVAKEATSNTSHDAVNCTFRGAGLPSRASTAAVPGSAPTRPSRPPPPSQQGGSATQPSSHRARSRSPKAPADRLLCRRGVRAPGRPLPHLPLPGTQTTLWWQVCPRRRPQLGFRPLTEAPRNLRPRSSRDKRPASASPAEGAQGTPGSTGGSAHTSLTHSRTPPWGDSHAVEPVGPLQLLSRGSSAGRGGSEGGRRERALEAPVAEGSVRTPQVQLTQLCGRGPDAQPLAPGVALLPQPQEHKNQAANSAACNRECRAQSERGGGYRGRTASTAPRRQAAAGQGAGPEADPRFSRGAWLRCP